MENKNELIAKWMGGLPVIGSDPQLWYFETPPLFASKHQGNLFYDTSWDWLMPVVEKINRMDKTSVSIYPKHCIVSVNGTAESGAHDFGSDDVNDGALIKIVYLSVVNYIEWYNQQSHGN